MPLCNAALKEVNALAEGAETPDALWTAFTWARASRPEHFSEEEKVEYWGKAARLENLSDEVKGQPRMMIADEYRLRKTIV